MNIFKIFENPIIPMIFSEVVNAEKKGEEEGLKGEDKHNFASESISAILQAMGKEIPTAWIDDVIKGVVAIFNIVGEFKK